MQLWAVTEARQISKAYVYDISEEAADKFISEMGQKLNLEIIRAKSASEIIAYCDIICTASSSATPLFDGRSVRPGTHINGIGSHTPTARELDTEIIKRSLLVADSYEACLKEAGDIMIPIQEGAIDKSHMIAELGEVVIGKKKPRTNNEQITLFKSNGLAIQDVATAKLVYDRALRAGVGHIADF
jgi:ornithine cyclodeaminase/alanine dehydrogenase-like protein (mu-crystallin family)